MKMHALKTLLMFSLLVSSSSSWSQAASGTPSSGPSLSNRANDAYDPFDGLTFDGVDNMSDVLLDSYQKTEAYQEIQYDGSDAEKAAAKQEFDKSVKTLDSQMDKALKSISDKWNFEDIKIEDYKKYQGLEVTEEDILKQEKRVEEAKAALDAAKSNDDLNKDEKRKARAKYEAEQAKLGVMKSNILEEGKAPTSLTAEFDKVQKTGKKELDERGDNVNSKADAASSACDGVTDESSDEDKQNCQNKRNEFYQARQAYFALQQSLDSTQDQQQNIPSDATVNLGLANVCNANAGPTCYGRDTTTEFPNYMISLATQECRMERAKRIRRIKMDSGCRNTGYGNNTTFKAPSGGNFPCVAASFLSLTKVFRFEPRFKNLFPNPITCRFPN